MWIILYSLYMQQIFSDQQIPHVEKWESQILHVILARSAHNAVIGLIVYIPICQYFFNQ